MNILARARQHGRVILRIFAVFLDEALVDPIETLGCPAGKTDALLRRRIAQPAHQPQPRLLFAVGQLIDAEPGEIGATNSLEMIHRAKQDLRALEDAFIRERQDVPGLVEGIIMRWVSSTSNSAR